MLRQHAIARLLVKTGRGDREGERRRREGRKGVWGVVKEELGMGEEMERKRACTWSKHSLCHNSVQ